MGCSNLWRCACEDRRFLPVIPTQTGITSLRNTHLNNPGRPEFVYVEH
jgi:hypothetical protein